MKKIFLSSILFVALFSSCKKDAEPEYNASQKGELEIEFDNIAGNADLQLNTGTYTNAANETFKVSTLKYFVSNFVFTNVNGTTYTVPQDSCYFLINESNSASLMPTVDLPEGEYSKVSFVLGVDSLRNTMDISKRTGSLDPAGTAAGMYWTWNSGYIFFKMEGTSSASTQTGNAYMYHIGLYGGMSSATINNIKTITLDLSAMGNPKIKASKSTGIHITADILKMFTGTTNVSIASNAVVMASAYSANVANNYKNMFAHAHTHN